MMNRHRMSPLQIRKLTCAALFLAIALVLPFITGQIPEIGSMLCPMHIPVLLCGFMCGWPWGLVIGFIAPLMRGVLFGMPPLFPTGVAMAFELAVYGGVSGLLHQILPKKKRCIYISLLTAMVCGRLVWGAVRLVLSGLAGSEFTAALFLAGALTNALPGIILQLVLIPVLVMAMDRAGLSLNRRRAAPDGNGEFIRDMLARMQAQREQYPEMREEDMVKFIFQGMLGVGHLLSGRETTVRYIASETAEQPPSGDEPLFERISPAWGRLNLRRAAAEGIPPEIIANMMLSSGSPAGFTRADAARVCRDYARQQHLPAMAKEAGKITDESWLPSHSEQYRSARRPSYRVIAAEWEPLLPAVCAVTKKAASGQRVLVTVDGPCASGKTTFAEKLAQALDASVVHTDDFVVPHAMKTPERLAVPGGNCDLERLIREVVSPWKNGEHSQYRRYDCRLDRLLPAETIGAEQILILEGCYSNLPGISESADVRLFMDTPEAVRMERLRRRESPESLQRFFEQWIPLEKAYFDAFSLPDRNCLRVSL